MMSLPIRLPMLHTLRNQAMHHGKQIAFGTPLLTILDIEPLE